MRKQTLHRKNRSRLSGLRGKLNIFMRDEIKNMTAMCPRNTGKSMSADAVVYYRLHRTSSVIKQTVRIANSEMYNVQLRT